jgi:hypothetical protein
MSLRLLTTQSKRRDEASMRKCVVIRPRDAALRETVRIASSSKLTSCGARSSRQRVNDDDSRASLVLPRAVILCRPCINVLRRNYKIAQRNGLKRFFSCSILGREAGPRVGIWEHTWRKVCV